MYSNKWIEFRKSEDEYFARRYDFMQDEGTVVNDLDIALSTVSDNETALRFLLETIPSFSIAIIILHKVTDIAIDSSNSSTIAMARKILFNYKDESLTKQIIKISVNNYLDDNDDWHYRRIAELYKFLNYKEELTEFALFCLANIDLEINEVGREFYPKD